MNLHLYTVILDLQLLANHVSSNVLYFGWQLFIFLTIFLKLCIFCEMRIKFASTNVWLVLAFSYSVKVSHREVGGIFSF